MIIMETQKVIRIRKSPRYSPPERSGFQHQETLNDHAIMAMNIWTGEFGLNEHYGLERFKKMYPFAEDSLEDDVEIIITHESIHQVLRSTVGLIASRMFDKITPYSLMKYYMDPF